MTVESTNTRVSHVGNGTTTVFAYPFYLYEASHLFVYIDSVLIESGYTVDGPFKESNGGTVTFDVAPADQADILFNRDTADTQETDYLEYDPFPAESHEFALDKNVLLTQENRSTVARAMLVPLAESGIANLPLKADRADKTLGFDENGDPIATTLVNVSVTILARVPTQNDDNTAGFKVNDVIRSTSEILADFTCIDNTTGAAIWVQDGLTLNDNGQFPRGTIGHHAALRLYAGGWGGLTASDQVILYAVPGGYLGDQNWVEMYRRQSEPRGGPARKIQILTGNSTLDFANSGINGLDTGSYVASTWYQVFLVSGSAGIGLVTSLDQPGRTEPFWGNLAGYDTWFARIGMVKTNLTPSGFNSLQQLDTVCTKIEEQVVSGSMATGQFYPLAAFIPPGAAIAQFRLQLNGASSATPIFYYGAGSSQGAAPLQLRQWGYINPSSTTFKHNIIAFELPQEDLSNPGIYCYAVAASSASNVQVQGWSYVENPL